MPPALDPPPSPPPAIIPLRKRAQFLSVAKGARAGAGTLGLQARRTRPDGAIGLGLTATRKIGGAVVRNRARRRLRAAAAALLPQWGVAGCDYVLIARSDTARCAWTRLLDDLKTALIRVQRALALGQDDPKA